LSQTAPGSRKGSPCTQRDNTVQFLPNDYTTNCVSKNLSDIYLQSQLRSFIDVIISLSITTCFGPYGPSSGECNYYLKHLRESQHYPNGSVVHKFVTYYIEGKVCSYLQWITYQHLVYLIVNNYILTFNIISNKFMNNGSVGIMMAFSKMF
jgi:hypothetical protein